MKKLLLTLAITLLLSNTALAKFNLPFYFFCKGKWILSEGISICSDYGLAKIKAKIPPTAGQIRAIDCQDELYREDFNTQIWKTGFWLWKRAVIIPSKTPQIDIPISHRYQENCPIYIGVASYPDVGFQQAVLFYTKKYDDFLEYRCAYGDWIKTGEFGPGVGYCKNFMNSTVQLKVKAKKAILNVIGSTCGISINAKVNGTGFVKFDMPNGVCVVDVLLTDTEGSKRTRLALVGINPAERELTQPVQLHEGTGKRKVVQPLGSEILSTEIIKGDEVIWRSGPKEEQNYDIEAPNPVNRNREEEWDDETYACHTAYSGQLNSIAGSCYHLKTNKQVPYFFK